MRKALGAWLRRLGYSLIHLAHRVDPVKGPFECPRCGGQGSILVRSGAEESGFVRQTCAFCKGRGSVMDRRSGVDRRRAAQEQAAAAQDNSSEQTASAPAPAATTPRDTGE